MNTGKHVPDETRLDQIHLHVPGKLRLESIISYYPDMTVGDLRRNGERFLGRVPNIGKKTIAIIWEFFGQQPPFDPTPFAENGLINKLQDRVEALTRRIEKLESQSSIHADDP